MLGAGRHHDGRAVADVIFIAVNNAFTLSGFKTEKLVVIGVHFHTDFFLGL